MNETADYYSVEEMENFLKEFLSRYREKIQKDYLPTSNLCDFSKPCQIHVFWFHPYDQQYFFVLHNDECDNVINIQRINYQNAVENLNKWIESDFIPKKMSPKSINDYMDEDSIKEILIFYIIEILDSQPRRIYGNWILTENKTIPIANIEHINKSILLDGFTWNYKGIIKLDMEKWLTSTLKQKPDENEITIIDSEGKIKQVTEVKAHTVFFYPTIWIGEKPFKNLRDYLRSKLHYKYNHDIVIKSKFRNYDLWISINGIIFLFCENKGEAHELLNELMAIIYMNEKYHTQIIKEEEIGEAIYNYEREKFTSSTSSGAGERGWILRTSYELKPEYFGKYGKIKTTSKKAFRDIIERANKQNPKYKKISTLILESQTLYNSNDINAAFLLSWITIESMLIVRWKDYIDSNFSQIFSSSIKKEITISTQWSISHILRSLQIVKLLDLNLANLIEKMKKDRNTMMHKLFRKDPKITDTKTNAIIWISVQMFLQLHSQIDWGKFTKKILDKIIAISDNWNNEDKLKEILRKN